VAGGLGQHGKGRCAIPRGCGKFAHSYPRQAPEGGSRQGFVTSAIASDCPKGFIARLLLGYNATMLPSASLGITATEHFHGTAGTVSALGMSKPRSDLDLRAGPADRIP